MPPLCSQGPPQLRQTFPFFRLLSGLLGCLCAGLADGGFRGDVRLACTVFTFFSLIFFSGTVSSVCFMQIAIVVQV